jgi:pyrroline-5-carboxylate reductase
MASSLIGGLIADGHDPNRIQASDPDQEQLGRLAARFGIRVAADNHAALAGAGVVVLAVKPQVLEIVARELAPGLRHQRPLLISIAAGVREKDLLEWLGGGLPLVRGMPNTPAMVQSGASVLHASSQVSEAQKNLAESIMRAVGITQWVDDESLMDAVTALSGSGPAYFFLIMEAMSEAGEELGLSRDTAHLLTLQTALGAARMAIESSETPERLRHRVTSPGGTTERALEVLEQGGIRTLFRDALQAARERSRELSERLGSH